MAIGAPKPPIDGVLTLNLTTETQKLGTINQELLKHIKADFDRAIDQSNSAGGSLAADKLKELFGRIEADIQQLSKEAADKLTHSQVHAPAPTSASTNQTNQPRLSTILDELVKDVNASIEEAIRKAENANTSLEIIEKGKQIVLVIEHVRNAYAAHLAGDKSNTVMMKTIDGLKKMAEDIAEKNASALPADLSSRIQKFVKDLPFQYWQPKVNEITSRFVAIDQAIENVMITVMGNFKYATTTGFEPSLTFGDTVFQPINSNSTRLDFRVPITVLGKVETNQRHYTQLSLQVPYEAGWLASDKQVFNYNKLWVETPALAQEQKVSESTKTPDTTQPPQETEKEKPVSKETLPQNS